LGPGGPGTGMYNGLLSLLISFSFEIPGGPGGPFAWANLLSKILEHLLFATLIEFQLEQVKEFM